MEDTNLVATPSASDSTVETEWCPTWDHSYSVIDESMDTSEADADGEQCDPSPDDSYAAPERLSLIDTPNEDMPSRLGMSEDVASNASYFVPAQDPGASDNPVISMPSTEVRLETFEPNEYGNIKNNALAVSSNNAETVVSRMSGTASVTSSSGTASVSSSSGGARLMLGGWLQVILQDDSKEALDDTENLQVEESTSYDKDLNDIIFAHQGEQLQAKESEGFNETEKPFECPVCNKRFAEERHIKVHFEIVHGGAVSFFCTFCRKKFNSSLGLKSHVLAFHKTLMEERSVCEKNENPGGSFVHGGPELPGSASSADAEHSPVVDRSLGKSQQEPKCTICGKMFASKYFLTAHQERMHKLKYANVNIDKGPSNCVICGKTFSSRAYLIQHREKIHKLPHSLEDRLLSKNCELVQVEMKRGMEIKQDPIEEIQDFNEPLTPEPDDNSFVSELAVAFGKQQSGNSQVGTQYEIVGDTFRCTICSKEFKEKGLMLKHIRRHIPEADRPCKCTVCGRGFLTDTDRERHMAVHSDEKLYKCSTCGNSYKQLSSLNSHVRMHRFEKPFACRLCGEAFKTKAQLTKHKEMHEELHNEMHKNDNLDGLICEICGKGFTKNSQLNRHRRGHFEEKKPKTGEGKIYECEVCQKELLSLNGLKTHMKRHLGDRPYACSVCQKAFYTMTDCKLHMTVHSDEKQFSCPQCGRSFKQRSSLNNHVRLNHKLVPVKCRECPMTFTSRHVLMKHKRDVHIGSKGHKCTHCEMEFYYLSSLKKHLSVHTGERPYICDICGQGFTQPGALTTHIRRHTGERPYVCNICDRAFTTSSSLVNHKRRHDGIKPYYCSICNRHFAEKSYYRYHMQRHNGETPYKCPICAKDFTANGHLTRHLRDVHKRGKPKPIKDTYIIPDEDSFD